MAQARLGLARLMLAAEVAQTYFDLVRLREALHLAEADEENAARIYTASSKKVEIGEAPAVQKIWAEIELGQFSSEWFKFRVKRPLRKLH